MAQEDEKVLLHEEMHDLLPTPMRPSERIMDYSPHQYGPHQQSHRVRYFTIVLVGSFFLNVLLAVVLLRVKSGSQAQTKTFYAGLSFGTVGTISHLSPYGPNNKNETERAILWENLDVSSAQVAVDKSWAAEKALPTSQEFAWDHNKAVYSLRGFHSQHCIRKIYRWITISYHSGTQLDHYWHIIHCLDSLLQDIHCYADDTPMMSPPKTSKPGMWGEGQERQCRDWNKLKSWAKMQNACFSYINETQGIQSTVDRYRWCPRDSPYRETMRSVLDLPDDWGAQVPKDIDSLPAYWERF